MFLIKKVKKVEKKFEKRKLIRGPNPQCGICKKYMKIFYLEHVTFKCVNCGAVYIVLEFKGVKK